MTRGTRRKIVGPEVNQESSPTDKDEAQSLSMSDLSIDDQNKLNEKMTKTLHNVILIMWRVTELDIRSTISKVCRKVTHDHSSDATALDSD